MALLFPKVNKCVILWYFASRNPTRCTKSLCSACFSQRPALDAVHSSLKLLAASASRLQVECRKAAPSDSSSSTVDYQLLTQQVIQCAYDIAKAAKQLVTITTREKKQWPSGTPGSTGQGQRLRNQRKEQNWRLGIVGQVYGKKMKIGKERVTNPAAVTRTQRCLAEAEWSGLLFLTLLFFSHFTISGGSSFIYTSKYNNTTQADPQFIADVLLAHGRLLFGFLCEIHMHS